MDEGGSLHEGAISLDEALSTQREAASLRAALRAQEEATSKLLSALVKLSRSPRWIVAQHLKLCEVERALWKSQDAIQSARLACGSKNKTVKVLDQSIQCSQVRRLEQFRAEIDRGRVNAYIAVQKTGFFGGSGKIMQRTLLTFGAVLLFCSVYFVMKPGLAKGQAFAAFLGGILMIYRCFCMVIVESLDTSKRNSESNDDKEDSEHTRSNSIDRRELNASDLRYLMYVSSELQREEEGASTTGSGRRAMELKKLDLKLKWQRRERFTLVIGVAFVAAVFFSMMVSVGIEWYRLSQTGTCTTGMNCTIAYNAYLFFVSVILLVLAILVTLAIATGRREEAQLLVQSAGIVGGLLGLVGLNIVDAVSSKMYTSSTKIAGLVVGSIVVLIARYNKQLARF